MSPSSQELEDCGIENVVHITLIYCSFQQALTKAVEKMIEAKQQIDKFGFNSSNTRKMTRKTFCQADHLSQQHYDCNAAT